MEANRILVLRGGALGDFIVTLPALALLRERWPGAQIELVGNATAAELARHRGVLNAVHSQHDARWGALFSDAPLPAALGTWLGSFDLVINYWPDPDGELRRRFPVRPGQMFLCADAMPQCAPAAAHYCAPLRALGLEPKQLWFRLNPVALSGSAETVQPLNERTTISIHPGSGSPRKNWPSEHWRALIKLLPPPLAIVLGEAETAGAQSGGDLLADLQTGRSESASLRLVNRPLEELVTHFAQCRLFLGHDSGISHLAAACGAPCVLFFGPTEPRVWAPPAPNVRVLHRYPDLNSLSVDEVRDAVQAALADQT